MANSWFWSIPELHTGGLDWLCASTRKKITEKQEKGSTETVDINWTSIFTSNWKPQTYNKKYIECVRESNKLQQREAEQKMRVKREKDDVVLI